MKYLITNRKKPDCMRIVGELVPNNHHRYLYDYIELQDTYKQEDTFNIDLGGEVFRMQVRATYLLDCSLSDNDAVLCKLFGSSISYREKLSSLYGYSCRSGGWPEWEEESNPFMQTKVVHWLYSEVAKYNDKIGYDMVKHEFRLKNIVEPAPIKQYNYGDVVKFDIGSEVLEFVVGTNNLLGKPSISGCTRYTFEKLSTYLCKDLLAMANESFGYTPTEATKYAYNYSDYEAASCFIDRIQREIEAKKLHDSGMSMVNATELSTISRTGESLATIPRKFPPQTMVTKDNVFLGARVVRGRDWGYGEQDSYSVGVVTSLNYTYTSDNTDWLRVIWANKHENSYRVGYKDCFDLYFASDECVPESKTITVVHDSLSKSYVDSKESIVWGSEPEPIFLSRLKIPIMI